MRRLWPFAVLTFIALMSAGIIHATTSELGAQNARFDRDEAASSSINRVYRDLLDRRATPAEIDRLLPKLGVSLSENEVRATVLGSREFFDAAGTTRRDFVAALYQEVRGRAPLHAESNAATQELIRSFRSPSHAREVLAERLLEDNRYDPDGFGVREVVLHTNNNNRIVRFAIELDRPFVASDVLSLSVSIGGRELDGVVRINAASDIVSFLPDQPVAKAGKIVASAWVQEGRATRLADISTASNNLAPRSSNFPAWPDEVFADQRIIALYGNHVTSRLGVLGETGPIAAVERVRAAAAPFNAPGKQAVGAFEMIVTVAQSSPGADGNYSAPSDLDDVRRWIDVAEAAGVYVILDIQPGRSDFLTESRRYESLLMRPNVGLALDPEWRLGPTQIPNQVVGSVSAAEINQVSAWLSNLVIENDLPEKIFIIHQFQERMITNREQLIDRSGLATTIHADGFGGRAEKQSTYSRIHVDAPFYNGFKLFIDEDRDIYQPSEVLRFTSNPVPDFVSYQ